MYRFYFLTIFLVPFFCKAQNLGGSATYNYLKLAASPQASALGGATVAILNNDVNLVHQNPALLNPSMHHQLGANINFMYGGIKNMFANYTKHYSKIGTTFNGAINFVSYGNNQQTDASGNVLGNFAANDYTAQITASRKYLEKWHYGATFKLIGSNYGQFKSYGVAFDVGLNYSDTTKLFKAGMVFKNIGTQLKAYNTGNKEPLPFEMQFGIAKKLEKAPVQFILTITNAHQFDIRYADTLFENEINGSVKKGKFTADKLFRHVILATQIYPTKNTEFTIAYNYLRRKELGVFNIANGFTGFSFGGGLILNTYQIRYARAYYQNTRAYNQIGVTIDFSKMHL